MSERASVPASPGDGPRLALLAGLASAGVVLFLFREVILGGQVLFERDVHLFWSSQREALVRALRAGSWPLWDPFISFGQPANLSAQLLYPPTYLLLWLPAPAHYAVAVVLHLVFSGVGLALLARRFGTSPVAAVAAAALWIASGPVQSLVNAWNQLQGSLWVPWVFLAADVAVERPGPRSAAALALVVGLQLLSGSPDLLVYTSLALVAFGLSRVTGRGLASHDRLRRLAVLATAALLAGGLTAAQWMTSLEVASRSSRRQLDRDARLTWSVHPATLVQAVSPLMLSDFPLPEPRRREWFDGREAYVRSFYLGLPAWVLAAAAWVRPRSRERRFLAALAAGALALALGRHLPGHDLLAAALPPLAVIRYPSKALPLAAFAVALLAAFGLDAWRSAGEIGRRRWLLAAVLPALLASAVAAAGVLAFGPGADAVGRVVVAPGSVPIPRRELLAPVAGHFARTLLACAVVLAAALLRRRWSARSAAVAALLGGLAVAEVAAYHRELNPVAPAALLEQAPPVRAEIRQADLSRLYVYEYAQMEGRSRRYLGRDEAYDPSRLPRAARTPATLAAALRLYPYPYLLGRWGVFHSFDLDQLLLYPEPLSRLTRFLRATEGTPTHLRLLQMGAVSQVVALHEVEDLTLRRTLPSLFAEDIRVMDVPSPLPRAYAVSGARVGDGPLGFRVLADPAFDPRREVLLPEGTPVPAGEAFSWDVRVASFLPDRVRLEAGLSRPGWVVLVDSWDPGWQVRVDGRPAPLLRANMAFRAVAVGEGTHVVEQVYRPRAFVAGTWISSFSALALLLLVARGRRGRASPDVGAGSRGEAPAHGTGTGTSG